MEITIDSTNTKQFINFYASEHDAKRLIAHSLVSLFLLYLHFAFSLSGLIPLWTLCLSAPVLVVRWMLSLHEVFHLRSEREVDMVTYLMPLMVTPFSLGYREFLDIHRRHHRFMATRQDPEWFQLRGNKLVGLLNAMTAPEQSYLRWIIEHGIDVRLARDSIIRLLLFVLLVALSGWAFLWYWLPVRVIYGVAYFVFFYCLHRRGNAFGVYPLHLPGVLAKFCQILFGKDALLATCYHNVHHGYPRIAAKYLPTISVN